MTTRRRRRTTSRRRPYTRRRRTSTASTLGTAVGALLAGVLAALVGGLPWWGWVLIVLAGLAVGALWAIRRGRAAEEPSPPEA